MPSTRITRPSMLSTRLPSARPVLAFPAASMNMVATVTAVRAIPRMLWLGR